MTDPDRSPVRTQLKGLVAVLQTSASSLLPSATQDLLGSIVEAAATIFGARAASIALIRDGETLEFVAAHGAGEQEILGRKIPIDRGIAGFVALTGQALAISDVEQDPRFDREFAASTGYVPTSILAAPLERHGAVMGVMEVLDKVEASAFAMQDMELMGIFGRQAALAIEQSEMLDQIDRLLREGLIRLANTDDELHVDQIIAALREADPLTDRSAELLELAGHIGRLFTAGDREWQACLGVLNSLANYVDHRRSLD